jgi:hypothetical protein
VNALFSALARPLGFGETARQRANVLLLILGDARLSGVAREDGRTVGEAAREALLALGPPYAEELPASPHAAERQEEEASSEAGFSLPRLSSGKAQAGVGLLVLAMALELLLLFRHPVPVALWRDGSPLWSLIPVALTTGLPLLLAVAGHLLPVRFFYGLGVFWLMGVGLFEMAFGLLWMLGNPGMGLLVILIGGLQVGGTVLLDKGASS